MLWPPSPLPWSLLLQALLVCVSLGEPTGEPSGSSSTANTTSPSPAAYRRDFSIQHGPCSYTFLLPEHRAVAGGPACWHGASGGQDGENTLQGDPPHQPPNPPSPRIQHLEDLMENYTQWLRKIERYVKNNLGGEMAKMQQNAVHTQTAAILDLSTNLISQTAQHTRKLTDVETQVLNQTSRLEIQLLENSLSTNKLETRLLQQSTDIRQLHDKNGLLEQRIQETKLRHGDGLESLLGEMSGLRVLLARQNATIAELQTRLEQAIGNNSILMSQQQQLTDTVNNLLRLCSKDRVALPSFKQRDEERRFRDCADVHQAGFNSSGVYTIHTSVLDTRKVYCNMESSRGGWTVIQLRSDGTTDFHRTWKEYKMGFGSVFGEHWLGNELLFLLTSQRPYILRVELTDWDGQTAFSLYDRFAVASEKHNYRLFLKSHSGTAGRQSSLVINGADFSTKDKDNDNCICKCALMLTGGWWFDACGPSNLNGMYHSQGQNTGKLNGIRWHYFKGSSYSLRSTAMMIRPLDF
ncbi:angiopoietin-1-like [Osmerus eperlanus]|uniref:angiopoietin-1-like n=1 Tax=Osmerus eperlanus TaxID=29151 RepID=UPI002E10789C